MGEIGLLQEEAVEILRAARWSKEAESKWKQPVLSNLF